MDVYGEARLDFAGVIRPIVAMESLIRLSVPTDPGRNLRNQAVGSKPMNLRRKLCYSVPTT